MKPPAVPARWSQLGHVVFPRATEFLFGYRVMHSCSVTRGQSDGTEIRATARAPEFRDSKCSISVGSRLSTGLSPELASAPDEGEGPRVNGPTIAPGNRNGPLAERYTQGI